MTLKDFSDKHQLDAQELLELLVSKKFLIKNINEKINKNCIQYLLEYKNKRKQESHKNSSQSKAPKKNNECCILRCETMTVGSLSKNSKIPLNECILFFINQQKLYSINHVLTEKEVSEFAEANNIEIEKKREENKPNEIFSQTKKNSNNQDKKNPVVVVVGHVDHGKTTLLDFIRKKSIAKLEKGGITQHIGSYEVSYKNKEISFIDTPGHEAFTSLRLRGITIADIAILVISAEDGIKPQTLESIAMLKKLNVNIIVAITKIDKVENKDYNPLYTKLSEEGLLIEEWGGDIPVLFISAKTGENIDKLLETILLISEVSGIATNLQASAMGYILETKLEKGRGIVANVILQEGVLSQGDIFLCGETWGKINKITDSCEQEAKKMLPGRPYTMSGFQDIPQVGEVFTKSFLKEAKKKSQIKKQEKLQLKKKNMQLKKIDKLIYPIILKGDTFSSLEAIEKSINEYQKIENSFYFPVVLKAELGAINENDIALANTSNASIYIFNLKESNNQKIQQEVKKNNITLKYFNVIYHMLEDIREYIEHSKDKILELSKVGELLVLKLFNIKGVGQVIGFRLVDGMVKNGATACIIRENEKIGEGLIRSLQKDKKSYKELSAKGSEGALSLSLVQEIKEGDIIEIYTEK